MTDEDKPILDIYTNNIQINVNLFEVMLLIGVSTLGSDGVVSQKDLVRVRMSPQEALAFNIMLSKQLELYKDTYKEIFLPDEMIKQLRGEKIAETTSEK